MIEKAKEIAFRYHRGQKDKVGKPYWYHPWAVADMVYTVEEKIVAYLHDVVEDTEYTEEMLRADFPELIADAVIAMSHKEKGEETYEEYIGRVAADDIARKVKIADMTHNMDMSRYDHPKKADYDRTRMYTKRRAELIAIDERK